MKDVVIVATGSANLASVKAGLVRAGANVQMSCDRKEIEQAERIVLPGVGTLAAAMTALNENDLVEVLQERILAGKPTLAVCLGLQLLFKESEESVGVKGLAVIDGKIKKFPKSVRIPQLGWNTVTPDSSCKLLKAGYAYFANSYRLLEAPAGWNVATTDYAGDFISAIEKGSVLACQFHPELSGKWGHELLERWLCRNFGE